MTDDRVETHVAIADPDSPSGRRVVHFQEYWVKLRAEVPAEALVFVGLDESSPAPGVIDAITDADLVIVPPSNPVSRSARSSASPGCARRSWRPGPAWSASPPSSAATTCAAWPSSCSPRSASRSAPPASASTTAPAADGGVLDGWLVDEADADDVRRVVDAGLPCRAVPLLMTDLDATAAMAAAAVELVAVTLDRRAAPDGAPEIGAGDDLAAMLLGLLGPTGSRDGDVVVVTSKVVAKAEGRVRAGDREDAIADETVRVVARRGPTTIVRTRHGLTLAAAGRGRLQRRAGPRRAAARRPRRVGPRRCADGCTSSPAGWSASWSPTPPAAPGARARPTSPSGPPGCGWPRASPAAPTRTATRSPSRLPPSPTRSPGPPSWRRASWPAGRSPWSAAGPTSCCRPDDDGPGAAALVRADDADLFGYGAREAVLRALAGDPADAPAFGARGLGRRAGRGPRRALGLDAARWPTEASCAPTPRTAGGLGGSASRRTPTAGRSRRASRRASSISGRHPFLRRLCRRSPTRTPEHRKDPHVAKQAKTDRQAVIEQIRSQQKSAEKRRGLADRRRLLGGRAADRRPGGVPPDQELVGPAPVQRRRHRQDRRARLGVREGDDQEGDRQPAARARRPGDLLQRRAAGVRRALQHPRPDGAQALHRGRPARARHPRAQPRARLHDPLVRRDRRRRRRRR